MRPLFACVLLGLMAPLLSAQDDGISGSWKVSLLQEDQQTNFWFLKLQNKDSELTGTGEALLPRLPDVKVAGKIEGELLKLSLTLPNMLVFEFEGKVPKVGAKKIYGSMSIRGEMMPAVLEASSAKNRGDLTKEVLLKTPSDPRVFSSALSLIADAKANMVPAKEVGEWVEIALRSAENYGPRWQADYTLKLVEALSRQPAYAALAVDAAKKLEKMLDAKTPADVQLRILTILGNALKAAGQNDEAKAVLAKVDGLETKAYEEYAKSSLNYEPQKFEGRKGKSQRAVLVELFTGAQCPPCVAADMGFDGLEKTYSTKEVVLLQYHLHIPRPDALTNADCEARQQFYDKFIEGTPTILFNGRPIVEGGGGKAAAPKMYLAYRQVVEKLLEEETTVKITASATRMGDKLQLEAKVTGVEKPGEKIRLRLALVEDWARYKGSNGLLYHHRIVRAMPGGPNGTAITKADGEKTVVVQVSELRGEISKYLDEFSKESQFPDAQRPLRLRNLHLVAFVQNDATFEVLQSVDCVVPEE